MNFKSTLEYNLPYTYNIHHIHAGDEARLGCHCEKRPKSAILLSQIMYFVKFGSALVVSPIRLFQSFLVKMIIIVEQLIDIAQLV